MTLARLMLVQGGPAKTSKSTPNWPVRDWRLKGLYPTSEVGNDFSTRIHRTRIRHHMGPASMKLYDKFGIIARVECTINDAAFFKLHRDGTSAFKLATLSRSIYSLRDLATCMIMNEAASQQLRVDG